MTDTDRRQPNHEWKTVISSPSNWEEFGTRTRPRGSSPPHRDAHALPEIVIRDVDRATLPASPDTGAADPGATPGGVEAWLVAGAAQAVRIMQQLRMGRGPENDCLLLERGVSRQHAVIRADETGDHWLLDLNTTNGTYLNASRVETPCRLQHGDRIRIGPFELTFQQLDKATHSQT